MTAQIQNLAIPSSIGPLEAILNRPERPTGRAAVVCHPHPLFGGTMHSHVVYQVARALRERGVVVLRFNFRGVGRSAGEYDEGRGERDDVVAAIDAVGQHGDRIWVCGFSFGSWVGLQVGMLDPRVRGMIGVGIPVATKPVDFLRDCDRPVAVIQGEGDEHGDPADVRRLLQDAHCPIHFEEIPGAGHFFNAQLTELRAAVGRAADFLEASHG